MYVTLQSIVLTSNTTFWWALQIQTEWVILSQPEHTIWVSRHRTLRTKYLHLDIFLWKQYIILASYKDFCKLQSFCLCTPLLFRHLPTEILIFRNVYYPIQCFSGDSFSFFLEQVSIIFHLLCWFHIQFKQGTQRHYNILNSTFKTIYQVPRKEFGFVLNMICFQFFLHYLVQPNQVIYFLFHIIFIIRLSIF